MVYVWGFGGEGGRDAKLGEKQSLQNGKEVVLCIQTHSPFYYKHEYSTINKQTKQNKTHPKFSNCWEITGMFFIPIAVKKGMIPPKKCKEDSCVSVTTVWANVLATKDAHLEEHFGMTTAGCWQQMADKSNPKLHSFRDLHTNGQE